MEKKKAQELSVLKQSKTRKADPYLAFKAAILIQRWYRRYIARLEMRRRCTWRIFRSIEYASEHDHLQLNNFFEYLMENFIPSSSKEGALIHRVLSEEVPKDVKSEKPLYVDSVTVPDSYMGPRLSFPLLPEDANALVEAFKQEKQLHAHYVLQVLHETRKYLYQLPNINNVSTYYSEELTVCGDLHGQLNDLFLIFHKNGLPSPQKTYIFNGDFVDRGKQSIEILMILFVFLLVYPKEVILNRGNHEDYMVNLRYGLTKEVMRKYKEHGAKILKVLENVFGCLPLATLVDQKVLIVHGGVSDKTDLENLAKIDRHKILSVLTQKKKGTKPSTSREAKPSRTPSTSTSTVSKSQKTVQEEPPVDDSNLVYQDESVQQVVDILWSDPYHQDGCRVNLDRGGGCYFGPDVTEKILQKHNLQFIIRSHECKPEGFEFCHNRKVLTVFSASNYYTFGSNRGAYLKMGPDLIPHIVQYQVGRVTQKLSMTQRISRVEESAYQALREKLYAHKSDLMKAFKAVDTKNTGLISLSEWSKTIESVLHLGLPWLMLRPQLVTSLTNGKVEYNSWLQEKLLEQRSRTPEHVQTSMLEKIYRNRSNLETIFNMIDTDHSGVISFEEFHQIWKLFSAHMNIDDSEKSFFNIAQSMDFNKDGNIDFNEFLEAFRLVTRP